MKKEKNFAYSMLKAVLSTMVKILYNPTILGKENIPQEGPVILAGNHRHSFDPFVAIIGTDRIVHFFAKKELFHGIRGKILSDAGIIRVNRERPSHGIIKKSIKYLQEGGIIGIFPEGTRNKKGEGLLEFKQGAVYLAQKNDAPIVPFAIRGPYKAFHKGLTVEFGEAMYVGDMELNDANAELRNKVFELFRK